MKILLIGGLGFVGIRFIRKFSNLHQIQIIHKKTESQNHSNMNFLKNTTLEYCSVEDKKIVNIIEKSNPDVVIHLAALSGIRRCLDDPQKAFLTNVYGTFNVIKACTRIGCKLIFCSTRQVYGETLGEKTKEDESLLPNNIYGLTKMLAEKLIKYASEKDNLDYTILRLTNVYGPEGDKYGAEIIIKDAIKNNSVQILGGTHKLNYIYVDDVVDILNFVLKGKNVSKQTFNVGSLDTITIKDPKATMIPNSDKILIGKYENPINVSINNLIFLLNVHFELPFFLLRLTYGIVIYSNPSQKIKP